MRYLAIILLITGSLFSQTFDKSYQLNKKLLELKSNQNTIPNSIKDRITFAPVTPNISKYPISNFIIDILKSGDTTWFSTGKGVMRTVDHFQSFQSFRGLDPFGNDDVAGLMLYNNVVAVSTARTEIINDEGVATGTGIKISTDRGLNWTSCPQPTDARDADTIFYGSNIITTLPVTVPQQNLSYDIAITKTQNDLTNYTVWITSFAGGLRKSTDYGNSWERVVLPPDNLDSIYIGGTGYNFVLNPLVNLNQRAFSIVSVNDSTLYVGTAGGINKSTDWGKSWRKYNYNNSGSGTNRVAGNFVVNLDVQRFNGKEIIWGATRRADSPQETNALSYTTNGGLNWNYTLKDYSPNNMSFKDSIIYGETDNGVWKSNFGTFNWNKPGLIYDASTKDQLRTTQFYCGNYFGDTLFFGSADGLLRTTEPGNGSWVSDWKIFRAFEPINLSSDIKTYAAPNPFAPDDEITRIFFKTGKTNAKVTIRIFDFGMNQVRTLIQNATRTSPDDLFTSWDGKNNEGNQVANGVYFYRVDVDSDTPVWGKILVLQ
ncbi:MAG: hypothetical protein JST55_00180 [Bacteroidetes bacterium]|nr:hypothetical protein [Bacteroidota bacterium]